MVIDSGGVLAINAGIILTIPDGSGNDITASKGCIINGPGTVRTQGNVEINLRGGSAFNAVLNVNTGITYAFDQTSPYDGSLFGNLIVDAGATLNCGNISGRHLSIFGSVTNNGTITASSTGGSYSINGPSLVNNGTLTCAGTVYFDSITSVSGSGLFTPSVTLVSGTVTLLSNITYSPSSYISMSPGGVLNPNGNTFTITGGSLGLDVGAEISSPGTVKSQNTAFDIRPGSAFNANLNINSGVNYAYSFASPYDGSLYGNLTIDAGATLNCGNISGRHLFIYGSIFNNGTLTASSTGGSYSINGPSLVNNGTVTGAGDVYFDSITSISGSGAFTPCGYFSFRQCYHAQQYYIFSRFIYFNVNRRSIKSQRKHFYSDQRKFGITVRRNDFFTRYCKDSKHSSNYRRNRICIQCKYISKYRSCEFQT
jgi:hypothetical protein